MLASRGVIVFSSVYTTLDIKTRNYKIRLWISQDSLSQAVDEDLQEQIVDSIVEYADYYLTSASLVEHITALSDKIEAIQVRYRHRIHKKGLMVYMGSNRAVTDVANCIGIK